MVIDASMCECIRPCLYSAYHHIDFVSQPNKSTQRLAFDVVGPVCESGDFLGKNRFFSIPNDVSTSFIAVMDVGAYCSSMASNYNLHPRPAEVFIDHDEDDEQTTKYILTRRPESLDDILGSYIDYWDEFSGFFFSNKLSKFRILTSVFLFNNFINLIKSKVFRKIIPIFIKFSFSYLISFYDDIDASSHGPWMVLFVNK